MKEDGFGPGIYLSVIAVTEAVVLIGLFWWLPEFLSRSLSIRAIAQYIRWGEILLVGFLIFGGRKTAGRFGLYSFLWHFALLLLSWMISGWVGLILISFPVLLVYYHTMRHVAFGVIPASQPDSNQEQQARLWVFFCYLSGLQLPFWKAGSGNSKEVEKRIDGGPGFEKSRGILWTHSHQVAGMIRGPHLTVDGPGLIFIEKGQQPFEIVDLRLQSRKTKINAISRDGIPFAADLEVSFQVDSEAWTNPDNQKLDLFEFIFRKGKDLDKNLTGTFPYSSARVKAVLGYRSKRSSSEGEQTERWDDHVLGMAEAAAQGVLIERNIEALWKARPGEKSTATEEISGRIKSLIENPLHRLGIRVNSVRASNFSFKDSELNQNTDEIEMQQLAAWSADWEKHRAIALAKGQAEAEQIQQEARAYAHSVMLTAIAEGLKQSRALHPNLPRYVIAMRFISTLEKVLEQQTELNEEGRLDARAKLSSIKKQLLSTVSEV